MPSFENLANSLFGGKRAETNSVLHDGETHTIIGTATGDSADGSVMVELSSDVTNPDELTIGDETYFADADTSVELPTTEAVKEGDEVLVSIYGGTPLRSPVVTGVVGSGDRVAADAEAAREIAEATGQHFWHNDAGAHVTELARPDWETQQTGPNSLWNSLGMLFRDGLTNLLALIAGTQQQDTFTVTGRGPYQLTAAPAGTIVITAGSDSIDRRLVEVNGNQFYFASFVNWGEWSGQTITVEYRSAPRFTFFNGEGNEEANVSASIAPAVASFARGTDVLTTAHGSVEFFDGAADIRVSSQPFYKESTLEQDDGYEPYASSLEQTITLESMLDTTKLNPSRILPNTCKAYGGLDFIGRAYMTDALSDLANSRVRLMASSSSGGYSTYYSSIMLDATTYEDTNIAFQADTVEFRDKPNATVDELFTIRQVISAIPVELFSGTYAQTYNTSITLSESAANFSRLDILYEDNSGQRNSVTISDPNGKRANCLMAVVTGGPYCYLKAKTYQISGRTIAVQDMGSYQRQGTARIGNNVATQANFNNEIGIVKVYGYR